MLFVYAALGALVWVCWRQGIVTTETVLALAAREPVLAPLVFIAVYALAVLFAIPSLPLNLGAGFLWGPVAGSVAALAGSLLGSSISFWVARTTLGQPLARRVDNRLLKWLKEHLERSGWKVVAFVRLNPAFPCGVANYLFGLTALRFRTYVLTSALCMYPLCLVFAWLGYSAGGVLNGPDAGSIALMLVAASATVLLGLAGRVLFKHFFGRLPESSICKGNE